MNWFHCTHACSCFDGGGGDDVVDVAVVGDYVDNVDDDYDVDDVVDDYVVDYNLLILTWFSSILDHLMVEYIVCHKCTTNVALVAHTYFVPHFVAHIFPTNENDCSLSHDLYWPMTGLEIVWKQILMKIVLNERYIILVYIFHTYFFFVYEFDRGY